MKPVTFAGEAFSDYFCAQLLWTDPHLKAHLDADGAEASFKHASATIRSAQRTLREREQARSTAQLLLNPLAELLGWRLGERARIATEVQEEEAGYPLLGPEPDRILARAICIAPDAHLDAAPSGLHRRFAPSLALPRVLRESNLTYGLLLNAFELRLIAVTGPLPSSIAFDLTAIADGTYPGLEAWKLLRALLRQDALTAQPSLLDRVREVGKQHQRKVTNELGQQVQRAVFRSMQGVIDHPANRGAITKPLSPELLATLYQETLHLLYRLLFILYAEDLALLPVDMLTYREGYSLGQLVRLARDPSAESLVNTDPNGSFLEASLRALFRLLCEGVKLGPEGEIKAYGGGLFDHGATATINALAWGNATVADVLEALTVVPAPRGQTGKVRLSYRELNVEQLGSIYEGLLELAPAYADTRLWEAELDTRLVHLTDAQRESIRAIRSEIDLPGGSSLDAEDDDEPETEDDESTDEDGDESESSDDDNEIDESEDEPNEETPKPKRTTSAKKPLKILREIKSGQVYPRGGQKRKQSGSYYTNRTFVEFLVREALDPKAEGKSPSEILALTVLDPAMGSGHFLVGACRRLAEHLLAAYRREVARCQAEATKAGETLAEDDLLIQANIPDELRLVWGRQDDDQILAVCRLLIAGHCLYGVDKNPLAVDLAKASLWLVTAASGLPLTFLDHRLRCGDSLLGIPAEELVRPWVEPRAVGKGGKSRAKKSRTIKPLELLISPRDPDGQLTAEFVAPNRAALCQAFRRALVCLQALEQAVEAEPTNFTLHRAKYDALRGLLDPWNHLHELRVGLAFGDDTTGAVDLINTWLDDLLNVQHVREEHQAAGDSARMRGQLCGAFCWELEFPEVFYDGQGNRRPTAGFSCVLGNPPWDKIKPERDGFYLQFDPLIRQFQATEKDRRIDELHQQRPEIRNAWDEYETQQKSLASVLLKGGIFAHQTAEIEEDVESDDGETNTKKQNTGGDPDLYRFFLERAWQLSHVAGGTVGIVLKSSVHSAHGATGVRRLLLEQNQLRLLCNFDNERKLFPGIDNRQDFDLLVFDKGGITDSFDAAFLTRETEHAIHSFRHHPHYMRFNYSDICKLSPQTLSFFELKGQRDLDIVRRAQRLHLPLGQGLMPRLGLKYRREFDMGNSKFLFRSRHWLRSHGCTQECGETWRAADANWYRERGYIERPIAQWYAVFDGDTPVEHRVPWEIPKGKKLRPSDVDDFHLLVDLADGLRLHGKPPDDGGSLAVFVPPDESRPTDAPVYVPGRKFLVAHLIRASLRPADTFLPLMEGKWIYQFDNSAYCYVSGSGSWVVTRPRSSSERDVVPQFFLASLDASTRTGDHSHKIGIRDITAASNERSFISTVLSTPLPCGHQMPTLNSVGASPSQLFGVTACFNSWILDFVMRLISGGHASLDVIKKLPIPIDLESILATRLSHQATDWSNETPDDLCRAAIDSTLAACFELTTHDFAHILSTFPLLDRDQPPLPHDYRLRATNKGVDRRRQSFITRDQALLTYFEYLAGRLEVKPDPDRVARICPEGVPEPPSDIVSFFADAGVDIGGATDRAVAQTGPIRDLRERVCLARELGAVAYVPTIDRRRASFVERAAAAGGLDPSEGVLTPEMAARVLRGKAEREAKWQRAMALWEATPINNDVVSPSITSEAVPATEAR